MSSESRYISEKVSSELPDTDTGTSAKKRSSFSAVYSFPHSKLKPPVSLTSFVIAASMTGTRVLSSSYKPSSKL